jgi:F-type H+-transporting ATPase subunit gamma
VLTSEQPFCGAFNQEVLALAERRITELRRAGPLHLIAVGQRGVRQLISRGIVPDSAEPAVTSLQGLRDHVKRMATTIDGLYAAKQVGELRVIYNRYQSVSEQVPTEEQILPLTLNGVQPPTLSPVPPRASYYRYLPMPVLLAGLVSEYAFISLYRTAADSYVSEQASRLIAMDGATRNTEKMLNALLDLERRERQRQITRQVLELISSGFC